MLADLLALIGNYGGRWNNLLDEILDELVKRVRLSSPYPPENLSGARRLNR